MNVLYRLKYNSSENLTLTRVVFELSIGNLFLVLLVNLTLTRVVFEFWESFRMINFPNNLTLTRVVFEYVC